MNEKLKQSKGKLRMDVIPDTALVYAAKAFEFGLTKYPTPLSWRAGLPASVLTNAVKRHLLLWQNGEDNAKDSGVHHIGHAIAGLMMLMDLIHIGKLEDDRPAATNLDSLVYEDTNPGGALPFPPPQRMEDESVKVTKRCHHCASVVTIFSARFGQCAECGAEVDG